MKDHLTRKYILELAKCAIIPIIFRIIFDIRRRHWKNEGTPHTKIYFLSQNVSQHDTLSDERLAAWENFYLLDDGFLFAYPSRVQYMLLFGGSIGLYFIRQNIHDSTRRMSATKTGSKGMKKPQTARKLVGFYVLEILEVFLIALDIKPRLKSSDGAR